jgi:hypothetical protein
MNDSRNLHIYEKILLLSLKDKEGTMFFGVHLPQALAGAIMAELLLNQKVKVEQEGKKKFLRLLDSKQTGDLLIDECLMKMHESKRRATIERWVQRFTQIRRLKTKAVENLIKKGILKLEEKKILLVFRQKIYPEVDPRPEKHIMDTLYKAIFGNRKTVDPETTVLVAICERTGILRHLFDRKKLKERKKWIKEIISGNLIGEATKEAVEAMQAAVMVAVIIPAVAVSAST